MSILLVLVAFCLWGCSEPQHSATLIDAEIAKFEGRDCIVEIRRDSSKGDEVSIFGTIQKVDKKGILIKDQRKGHEREYWIPEHAVVLIEMR